MVRRLVALMLLLSTPLLGAVKVNSGTLTTSLVVYRDTPVPGGNPYTITFWLYQVATNTVADSLLAKLEDGSSNSVVRLRALINTRVLSLFTLGNTAATGSTLSLTTWYFIAIRRSGTTYEVYLNGSATADITATWTTTATGPTRQRIAVDSTTGQCECRFAAVKIWDAYLTPAEIQNERWGYRPRRTANLFLWYPFNSAGTAATEKDFSGGAHNFTLSASDLTLADGPPISW